MAAAPDGEPAGLIVDSFTSVSLEPPLVSFCAGSLTWSRIRRAGRFGVNVSSARAFRCARAAAASADRFAGLDWSVAGRCGMPLVTDALACLECEIVSEHPAGNHSIVVGGSASGADDALVFFVGALHGVG